MERDTPGKYEQFAAPSDLPPPPAQAGQSTQQQQFYPRLDLGNQFGNQFGIPQNIGQPNSGQQGQPGQPSQGWPNQQARIENELAGLKLSEKEQQVLRNCKTGAYLGITLPMCAGYVIVSKFNALKHLKPVPPLRMFFGVGFTYVLSKIISMGFCLTALRMSSPEFDEKIKKLKQLSFQQRPETASDDSQPSPSLPSNQGDYRNLQQQRFSNPNNPYLAANQQQKEKEFVDDNYDFGNYKSN